MERRVKIGKESLFISFIALDIWGVCMLFGSGNKAMLITLGLIMALMMIAMCYYAPVSVVVDEDAVVIKRRLRNKVIPMSLIESAVPFTPASLLQNQRFIGSSGFFGYWGWFTDREIGTYFAYYGNPADCFLLLMKDGRKYVVGCEDSQSVAAYISDNI